MRKALLAALLTGALGPAIAPCNDALPECGPQGHCGQKCIGTKAGEECTAECGEGYVPVEGGNPDYRCDPKGIAWVSGVGHLQCKLKPLPPSPGSPACDSVKCGALPASRASNTDGNCEGTAAEDSCTAKCKTGYVE